MSVSVPLTLSNLVHTHRTKPPKKNLFKMCDLCSCGSASSNSPTGSNGPAGPAGSGCHSDKFTGYLNQNPVSTLPAVPASAHVRPFRANTLNFSSPDVVALNIGISIGVGNSNSHRAMHISSATPAVRPRTMLRSYSKPAASTRNSGRKFRSTRARAVSNAPAPDSVDEPRSTNCWI